MEKETLVNMMINTRADWEETMAALGAEGLEKPGAAGEWRVRDVLAHCIGYDRWQLVQLRCAFTGEIPTQQELTGGIDFPPNTDMHEDAMNAMFVAGMQSLDLEIVLKHWREVAEMRLIWATNASQSQFNDTVGADWSGESPRVIRRASEVPTVSNPLPAWQLVLDQVEHEQEHLKLIHAWMRDAAK